MLLRILALILLIPVIIILIAVLINIIPLPGHLEDSRQFIAAILAGIVSFIYLSAITIYTIYSFRRLGRIFDSAAEDMGLEKKDFMYFGKGYKGIWQGRDLEIEYFPPKAIQGALLNICLSGNMKISAAISKKAPLLDRETGKDPVRKLEYGFYVYSSDREGVKEIFYNDVFIDALDKILEKGKRGYTLQVYIRKSNLYLRSRLADLGPKDLKIFLNSLEVMAGIMENK